MRKLIELCSRVRGALVLLPCLLIGGQLAWAQEGERPPIPSDLLGDEHVREEFGVNQFTTPSIRRLFEMLDELGSLSYDDLKRPISDRPPSDRVLTSLGLGMLIADGFLIVQCEKVEDIEPVGRAILKYGKAMGTGSRMNRHTQSLFENSLTGNWDQLRAELAMTQADVEAEMVQLRDVDLAHLISLGGWLRAFDISTSSVANQYTEDRSRQLTRRDIAEYYMMSLETLHPTLQQSEVLTEIREGLEKMLPMLDVPRGKALRESEVKTLNELAASVAEVVTSRMND
jgi:hypothetical protein